MANLKLIAYLEKQKAEREQTLADYEEAVSAKEMAEAHYRECCAKVESFGDIAAVEAECAEIVGFISEELGEAEELAGANREPEQTTDNFIANTL